MHDHYNTKQQLGNSRVALDRKRACGRMLSVLGE
jgi:hypothetical protein